MDPEVRPRLYLATASLATTAGWMSFEVKQHDAARRLWMIGLDVARATDHPQVNDLTVFLLYDMALQAVHLGRPEEALRLVHLGHAAAPGPCPVSSTTACRPANGQALAHAAQGEVPDCKQTLGKAEEHFSNIDPTTSPAWGSYFDAQLHLPAGTSLRLRGDDNGALSTVLVAPDGSWCQVPHEPDGHGEHQAAEAGHQLWSAVEAAAVLWEELPQLSWEHLGLTAEPGGRQWAWVNSPDSKHAFAVKPAP